MYKIFVLACFLGVLFNQVDANAKEKIECLRRVTVTNLYSWRDKMAKVDSCPEILNLFEELYEYLEDCSIDGSVLDSLSLMVDDICTSDSKMFEDVVSGKECWPSTYPLHMAKCAFDYFSKLIGESINLIDLGKEKFNSSLFNLNDPGKSCPSFKPLFHCLKDSVGTLCKGKSTKMITRLINGMDDLGNGLCNTIPA